MSSLPYISPLVHPSRPHSDYGFGARSGRRQVNGPGAGRSPRKARVSRRFQSLHWVDRCSCEGLFSVKWLGTLAC